MVSTSAVRDGFGLILKFESETRERERERERERDQTPTLRTTRDFPKIVLFLNKEFDSRRLFCFGTTNERKKRTNLEKYF